MSRLEGKKSNASVLVISIILLLAVAAVLYFLFAGPADQTPADTASEPVPGATEPAVPETEPTPINEVEPNAPVGPAPENVEPGSEPNGAVPGFATPVPSATPVPGATPESLGPDNAPSSDTIESL